MRIRFQNLHLVILLIPILAISTHASASTSISIKRTLSGICHDKDSRYFDHIKKYEHFTSIEECLSAGGRALKSSKQSRTSTSDGYRRSMFGHGWEDIDCDCQNQRAEALINTSSLPVRFAKTDKCRVITGRWISPFTGEVIQNSSDIDIDHVVPLAWAWRHGANNWHQEKREKFANDLINLWPVEASLNRSKGASGPDEWLPPKNRCQYVARFMRITKIYTLNMSKAEKDAFEKLLSACS
ncbi:HNH endonuclease family protein [Marinobacter alexandrii]|uniref:HNH endonuclease family protein n=1 Tax=Marinobacter alexandrii TaxID=2570351 RepID=UPI002ABD4101|nr:HNH endonuclease family protein [Marinobacter alexandrii]